MVLCKVFHDTYKAYLLKVALSSSLELQSFKENSVLELIVDRKPPIREHANIAQSTIEPPFFIPSLHQFWVSSLLSIIINYVKGLLFYST